MAGSIGWRSGGEHSAILSDREICQRSARPCLTVGWCGAGLLEQLRSSQVPARGCQRIPVMNGSVDWCRDRRGGRLRGILGASIHQGCGQWDGPAKRTSMFRPHVLSGWASVSRTRCGVSAALVSVIDTRTAVQIAHIVEKTRRARCGPQIHIRRESDRQRSCATQLIVSADSNFAGRKVRPRKNSLEA